MTFNFDSRHLLPSFLSAEPGKSTICPLSKHSGWIAILWLSADCAKSLHAGNLLVK